MKRIRSRVAMIRAFATAVGLFVAAGTAAAAGVTVALTPTTQQVEPGGTVTIDMTITEAGSAINAFYTVIGWDPAALTPVSHQEGSLMTGACAQRFHSFAQGVDRDTIADALLCSGVSVTGPGQLYRLVFQASTTPQVTQVRFLPGLQFYNAGLFVNPAYATDATIGIGAPVDAGAPHVAGKLRLDVSPNPARGRVAFSIESDQPGLQRVRLFDLRGRMVRRFEDSVSTAGVRSLVWDGRDAAGEDLPAGVYLVTLQVAGRSVSSRVALLR